MNASPLKKYTCQNGRITDRMTCEISGKTGQKIMLYCWGVRVRNEPTQKQCIIVGCVYVGIVN